MSLTNYWVHSLIKKNLTYEKDVVRCKKENNKKNSKNNKRKNELAIIISHTHFFFWCYLFF